MSSLPIVTFHSIDPSGSPVSMSRDDLEALLTRLASAGWRGTTLSRALAPASDQADATRLVGLCFDDGYRNVLEQALPVLRDLEFTATVFLIAGRCGQDNRWPGQAAWVPTLPLLDWEGAAELAAADWEIGSHGMSHRPLTALDPAAAAEEMAGSRAAIESRLGAAAPLFAYPYGEHDDAVLGLAREHYEAAFGVRLALAQPHDLEAGFAIPRLDAHYLRHMPARILGGSPGGRSYIALRRWIRGLRGAHWSPVNRNEPMKPAERTPS